MKKQQQMEYIQMIMCSGFNVLVFLKMLICFIFNLFYCTTFSDWLNSESVLKQSSFWEKLTNFKLCNKSVNLSFTMRIFPDNNYTSKQGYTPRAMLDLSASLVTDSSFPLG